jgi:hypothetical protein
MANFAKSGATAPAVAGITAHPRRLEETETVGHQKRKKQHARSILPVF